MFDWILFTVEVGFDWVGSLFTAETEYDCGRVDDCGSGVWRAFAVEVDADGGSGDVEGRGFGYATGVSLGLRQRSLISS